MFVNGSVVGENGISELSIEIEDGKIIGVLRALDPPTNPNAPGYWYPDYLIFPGFIDLNVSRHEPLAALNGGATFVEINGGLSIPTITNFNYAAIQNADRVRVLVDTISKLEMVENMKSQGRDVWSEIHPQYLYFDNNMITPENATSLRVEPTFGTPENRLALLEALKEERIDLLTSGHASRSLDDESKHGMPMSDTFGSMIVWLIEQGVKSETIFKMACKNPNEFKWLKDMPFNGFHKGYKANIVILAMNQPMINSRQLYTECGWSPFDLRTLHGSVRTVYQQGNKVVDAGWMADLKTS